MQPDPQSESVFEPDMQVAYTLEVLEQLTGVSTQTIRQYREEGLIRPMPVAGASKDEFDEQALRTLRRIETLRATCETNMAGLKLLLALMDEVERLSEALRARR